jgi:hypothetical protein
VVRSPTLATCLVGAILLALAVASVGVQGAGQPPAAELRLASGTLSLSNSLNGAAILNVQNLKPGGSAAGTVEVTNTGSLDGQFSLSQQNLVDAPGPFGGRLSDYTQLGVEQIAPDGSLVGSVYSGTLSGLGSRDLGTLDAGESRTYRFTVALPDTGIPPAPGAGDNAVQRSSLQADYVWTATADKPGGGGGNGGGNGGGGSNGNGGNGGGDWATPGTFTLKLSGKKKQRLRKRRLVVDARCSASCRLTAAVKIKKARGTGKVRLRKSVAAPAGKRKRLTIKLSRRAVKAVSRVLRKRRKAVAVVTVTGVAGGVTLKATRRIIIRR